MQNSIKTLLDKLGIKSTVQGKEVILLCPFHNDKHASMNISVKTGQWKCWSCLTGGKSLETFLKKLKGPEVNLSDYLTDIDLLNGRINALYSSTENSFFSYEDYYSFREIVEHEFRNNFVPAITHETSLKYLTGSNRKLTVDTIERFALQYAPTGDYAGRIIIPYFLDKQIVGFNSRLIESDKSNGKEMRYRYCIHKDSFKEFVYGIEEVKNPIILVEGPFDLMWMKQLGYKNTVSSLSTLIRPMQLFHLMKFDTMIFLFDNDENKAGYKAVLKNAETILEIDKDKKILFGNLPDFKDPNSSTKEEISETLSKLKQIRPVKDEFDIVF